jgi:WD40 repeat protein
VDAGGRRVARSSHCRTSIRRICLSDVQRVHSVAVGRLGDRDVIVSGGGDDDAARVWDWYGQPIGDQLTGHTMWVRAVAVGRLGDRDVVITSSCYHGAVWIWDQDGQPIAGPMRHSRWVHAVAVGRLGDRDVVVSGGDDGTLRVWDPRGQPIGDPIAGHAGAVRAVELGWLGDGCVIVSGGDDRTVRVWASDQSSIAIIDMLEPLTGISLSTSNAIYASSGNSICRWDEAPIAS